MDKLQKLWSRNNIIIIPFIFFIIVSIIFQYASSLVEESLIDESFINSQHKLNILAVALENNANRNWDMHETSVIEAIEYLDTIPSTYSSMYEYVGDTLTIMSERTIEIGFDPFDYPEFIDAVTTQDTGTLYLDYDTGNGVLTEHVYFRWMPDSGDNKYLGIVGINKHSIVETVPVWISITEWICIIITLLIQLWLVLMINHCRHCENRK